MKIFNKENGKEKVYIQVSDFTTFTKVDRPIPAGIYWKAMNYKFQSNDDKYNFIEYSDPEEVEFFKNFDYIVDYKEVKDKDIKELQALAKIANDEANEISDLWNELTPEEKKLNVALSNKYMLLHHKIQDYAFVLWNKQRHIKLNMPLVPDSDSTLIINNDNCNIQSSLEPNILLYYRKDGDNLSDNDINMDLVNSAIATQVLLNEQDNEYFRDYRINKRMSEDNKYYIVEFDQPEYKEDLRPRGKNNYNKNMS